MDLEVMLLENKRDFYKRFIYSDIVANKKTNEILGYKEMRNLEIETVTYIDRDFAVLFLKSGEELELEIA